ncbi:hypothetical protein MBLNU459_g5978t1 [Dothideomycetes sp. NU459]
MEEGSVDSSLDSEKLLGTDSDLSSHEDLEDYLRDQQHQSRQTTLYKRVGFLLLILLVATNLGWWWGYRHTLHVPQSEQRPLGSPELTYFLQGEDSEHVMISFEHDWRQLELVEADGYRYGDVHWAGNKWNPDHGATVAVSKQFVEENHLFPGAAPVEDNATEFHYLVAGYHQLHCLRQVRDAIYYLNGTLEDWPGKAPFMWDHILHCIEAVRQGIHCGLDPTLIPLDSYWPGIPNGQRHICRNRDALFKWTSEHGYPYPAYDKQAPPARTQEWLDRTKDLNLPPWQPDPAGPPVGESRHG